MRVLGKLIQWPCPDASKPKKGVGLSEPRVVVTGAAGLAAGARLGRRQ
jgi:hypothetical protein